ncbi:MAG: DUF3825 domain-containing protein, partial [Bacteroidaceae bacterium]|nr:DUF3825 domain-containing protein [Bacteroidaceae bacterium]
MKLSEFLPNALKKLTPINIEGIEGEWYNIAQLGKLLKENQIEYGKLKDTLSQIDEIEMYIDNKGLIPVTYIRYKDNYEFSKSEIKKTRPNRERQALFDWAYLGIYNETISKLKTKALDEPWTFENEPNGNLSILDSYLCYTFFRIQKENKICYTKDRQ